MFCASAAAKQPPYSAAEAEQQARPKGQILLSKPNGSLSGRVVTIYYFFA